MISALPLPEKGKKRKESVAMHYIFYLCFGRQNDDRDPHWSEPIDGHEQKREIAAEVIQKCGGECIEPGQMFFRFSFDSEGLIQAFDAAVQVIQIEFDHFFTPRIVMGTSLREVGAIATAASRSGIIFTEPMFRTMNRLIDDGKLDRSKYSWFRSVYNPGNSILRDHYLLETYRLREHLKKMGVHLPGHETTSPPPL
jgi:hypothetical protein